MAIPRRSSSGSSFSTQSFSEKNLMTTRQLFGLVMGIIVIVMLAVIIPHIYDCVDKGSYHIIQRVTGNVEVQPTPGPYLQNFGDITIWPVSDTFFFTASQDVPGDTKENWAIEVRFNDGSKANIEGTCRVNMPVPTEQRLALVLKYGHKTYSDMENKLIYPYIRNVLNNTANLMSARESYSEKRRDFVVWSWDQLQSGMYQIGDETIQATDFVTGEKTSKVVKVIMKSKEGNPIRVVGQDPLSSKGITLDNFEIKNFIYEPTVEKQISEQQAAMMSIATAIAQAKRAEQEKASAESQGQANVMKSKYEAEQIKVKAVVEATKEKEVAVLNALRDKEVAETGARKNLEVATLAKQTAEQTRQEQILLGEGEAKRKELVLNADGYLTQKLEVMEKMNRDWADAFSKRQVPGVVMGSEGGSSDKDAMGMQTLINLKLMESLGVNLNTAKPQPKK